MPTEVLRPRKRHSMYLFVFVFSIFVLILVVVSFLVDAKPGVDRPRASIVAAVVFAIPSGIVFFALGRFIVIDSSRGISKPTIFRKSERNMIPFDDIKSYSIVYLMEDDTKVAGVIIRTTKGKSIRYSDYRTPECSTKILRLLQEHGVSEFVPEKKYWG
jgi:hypothetical protein